MFSNHLYLWNKVSLTEVHVNIFLVRVWIVVNFYERKFMNLIKNHVGIQLAWEDLRGEARITFLRHSSVMGWKAVTKFLKLRHGESRGFACRWCDAKSLMMSDESFSTLSIKNECKFWLSERVSATGEAIGSVAPNSSLWTAMLPLYRSTLIQVNFICIIVFMLCCDCSISSLT